MAEIVSCRIHPGIGIARIGNSPTAYFIGPEAPGVPASPAGDYKDDQGWVKRQAARFRVYGYDAAGNVVRELDGTDAEIIWRVHLANTKASWFQFGEAVRGGEKSLRRRRNSSIRGKARRDLEIDPGRLEIRGIGTAGEAYRFDGGSFLGRPVPLGELRTDPRGRLLVLGGFGVSSTVRSDNPITHFADNDFWHDDTSDGPISATVRLKDGRELDAEPAWVIVTPPDFAPQLTNVITLFDVVWDVAIRRGWLNMPERPSFTRHIHPVLERASRLQWVNPLARIGHGLSSGRDFTRLMATLADNRPASTEARRWVFRALRDPERALAQQASFRFMPPLSGDGGPSKAGEPSTWLTLTRTQFHLFRQWSEGQFDSDWTGETVPVALEALRVEHQPGALDRAALEACVGGAFFPGIESPWVLQDPRVYARAFRLKPAPALQPGDLCKRLAVPWQADFYKCAGNWWPAQRPDDVLSESAYEELMRADAAVLRTQDAAERDRLIARRDELLERRLRWDRGVGEDLRYVRLRENAGHNAMVSEWSRLGFIVPRPGPDHGIVFVETERARAEEGGG